MARSALSISERLQPVLGQRVVVVDPGTRCLKVLVVESMMGQVRVLQRQAIDLQEESLVAPEEIQEHFQRLLPGLGPHSVALILPQHRTISQVLEVPPAGRAEERKAVEAEAVKASGLSESGMLFEFVRLKPFGRHQHPCRLTLCRAADLWDPVSRFTQSSAPGEGHGGVDQLAEVSSTAEGLFAAGLALHPRVQKAVLVDLGANNTVVGIVFQGQGVSAASFPIGSAHFTAALAALKHCSLSEAEDFKCSHNSFYGDHAVEGLGHTIDAWLAELRRSVNEWIEDNSDLELTLASLPVYLCGGGARQEGLVDYLNKRGEMTFQKWPSSADDDRSWPMEPYRVAYGAALHALGKVHGLVSLLPAEAKAARARRILWRQVQLANSLLLLAGVLLLGLGTWQKASLLGRKHDLVNRTETALVTAGTIDSLSRRLNREYEEIHPVLVRQRQTVQVLQTLNNLEQVRTNKDFWYVLIADATSYFSGTTLPGALTNLSLAAPAPVSTNAYSARREFIAELCIPQEGEDLRRVLSQIVTDIKRSPLFVKADTLAPERRRNLVDPRVVLTNHYFTVAMEVSGTELQAPVVTAELSSGVLPARDPRRSPAQRPKPERPTGSNRPADH